MKVIFSHTHGPENKKRRQRFRRIRDRGEKIIFADGSPLENTMGGEIWVCNGKRVKINDIMRAREGYPVNIYDPKTGYEIPNFNKFGGK